MTITDWRLKSQWVKNCNCAFGCPCDFNARPTHVRNPVTDGEHRILVMMPEGSEHRGAEAAAAHIESTGAIKFIVLQRHGSLAQVEHTPQGVAA
jgi:hypothetical protein